MCTDKSLDWKLSGLRWGYFLEIVHSNFIYSYKSYLNSAIAIKAETDISISYSMKNVVIKFEPAYPLQPCLLPSKQTPKKK